MAQSNSSNCWTVNLLGELAPEATADDVAANAAIRNEATADDVAANAAIRNEATADPVIESTNTVSVVFGEYELDPALCELRRDVQRVAMEPQVYDVLVYLIERRGHVVSKHELLDEVWGDRFVSEGALSSRIAAARRATGDDGKAQRVIRTVHGKGFTFVADVRS